ISGILIAVTLELCGVSALPVAVGMYLSLDSTLPIFIGGMIRLMADRIRGKPKSEAEAETSPGLLLASGLIAGGTLCGLLISFFPLFDNVFDMLGKETNIASFLDLGKRFFGKDDGSGKAVWDPDAVREAKITATVVFGLLAAFLLWVGSRKNKALLDDPK
ncbi:MAG TPA: OPT/YSL family transporter, partial [Fimbriiglobus sp.]